MFVAVVALVLLLAESLVVVAVVALFLLLLLLLVDVCRSCLFLSRVITPSGEPILGSLSLLQICFFDAPCEQ